MQELGPPWASEGKQSSLLILQGRVGQERGRAIGLCCLNSPWSHLLGESRINPPSRYPLLGQPMEGQRERSGQLL